jgi:hypothetical protein
MDERSKPALGLEATRMGFSLFVRNLFFKIYSVSDLFSSKKYVENTYLDKCPE